MIKEILRIIDRDGYISKTQIAHELGTSSGMVDAIISQLLETGYLLYESTGENCSTICAKCPFAQNCSKEIIKIFKMSDKGKRYLSN